MLSSGVTEMMDKSYTLYAAGVLIGPLAYLFSIAVAVGFTNIIKKPSTIIRGLIESLALFLVATAAVLKLQTVPPESGVARIAGFDIALFYLLGFYTLFSYSLYTLGLNKLYRDVMEPTALVNYVSSTSSRLLVSSLALLYVGGLAMFTLPLSPEGVALQGESLALIAGAVLVLFASVYSLLKIRGDSTAATARVLSASLLLASVELVFVGIGVRKGLVSDYTGAFLGAILFAITLMAPILLFYSIQFSPQKLELIGLEAFYRGVEQRESLELVVRLLLTAGPLGGITAGLTGLVVRGYISGLTAGLLLIVVGLVAVLVVLSVASGGLTGRVLPLAMWFAKRKLSECTVKSLEGASVFERAVLKGVGEYLCGRHGLTLACTD